MKKQEKLQVQLGKLGVQDQRSGQSEEYWLEKIKEVRDNAAEQNMQEVKALKMVMDEQKVNLEERDRIIDMAQQEVETLTNRNTEETLMFEERVGTMQKRIAFINMELLDKEQVITQTNDQHAKEIVDNQEKFD